MTVSVFESGFVWPFRSLPAGGNTLATPLRTPFFRHPTYPIPQSPTIVIPLQYTFVMLLTGKASPDSEEGPPEGLPTTTAALGSRLLPAELLVSIARTLLAAESYKSFAALLGASAYCQDALRREAKKFVVTDGQDMEQVISSFLSNQIRLV
jgi:hypothetical protein